MIELVTRPKDYYYFQQWSSGPVVIRRYSERCEQVCCVPAHTSGGSPLRLEGEHRQRPSGNQGRQELGGAEDPAMDQGIPPKAKEGEKGVPEQRAIRYTH